jgi:FAD binding domain
MNVGRIFIQGLTCEQVALGDPKYGELNDQYATSSYGDEHNMKPGLIVKPSSISDIGVVLEYAKANNLAVAIRTGGHQYSGASSTSEKNILLDLKDTFRGPKDQALLPSPYTQPAGKQLVKVITSVSYSNAETNAFLKANGLFVPHGVCGTVYLGGHVQTGGYGMLIRNFGLFGDHVEELYIINQDGKKEEISKRSHPELFEAILGGSPGNFGIVTHIILNVHRDIDYKNAKALRARHDYDPVKLENFLKIAAEYAENPKWPRNYELCINVLSSRSALHSIYDAAPDDKTNPKLWERSIVVYAVWVPHLIGEQFDPKFFDDFTKGSDSQNTTLVTGMVSEFLPMFILPLPREFDLPYIKRTYVTASNSLRQDGWPAWCADRIDTLVAPEQNRCYVASQLQVFGGEFSQFRNNAGNGTSYSWRDSTFGVTMDGFHHPESRRRVMDWQKVNDMEAIGPKGKFSKQDRRVFWGSYGSFDLDEVWNTYHETEAKYKKLGKVRSSVDSYGLFTPNAFAVKKA